VSYSTIKYRASGPLAWITLNRPEKLNAINGPMVAELNAALDQAETDQAVRVIILNGEGRAFSAGFDLGSGDESASDLHEEVSTDLDVIMRFWDCPKPTIAAVHTYCLGSAMEMALACDLTISAGECRFGAPEVKFGSGILAMVWPWICGPKRAKELLLTGNDRISAQKAESWGLVNRVVANEKLREETKNLAMSIARNDVLAVQKTKKAINRSYDIAGMRKALQEALEIYIEVETTETEDSAEFNRILKAEGARAAIAWRDAKLEG